MGTFRTKEDDVAKISTTVYVTNFPESLSAKELFNSCKVYGYVVDSFIPTKRSKNGKRFGFVRFINMFGEERLKQCKGTNVDIKGIGGSMNSNKNFVSMENGKPKGSGNNWGHFVCEGFVDIKIQYMGEFWVMMKFANIESIKKFRENVSIGTWFSIIKDASLDFHVEKRIAWDEIEGIPFKLCILEEFKIIYRGKVYWIRAKETSGWVPDFNEEADDEGQEDTNSNDDGFNDQIPEGLGGNSDGEEVNENILNDIEKEDEQLKEGEVKEKEEKSKDPFNIYTILNKKTKKGGLDNKSESCLNNEDGEETDKSKKSGTNKASCINIKYKEDGTNSTLSGHFKKSKIPRTEGSILGILEEVVKVGQIMGYNMEGCMSNMTEIIEAKGVEEDYLQGEIRRWKGEVIVMGDFNKGLIEVDLGGCVFTWCHKSATKMSKLDRFLVSENIMTTCPNVKAITLESKTVEDAWKEYPGKESNAMRDEEVMNKRVEMINKLQEIDKLRALEVAQKAKIKWVVEGEENSRFFHGMLNKKRNIQNNSVLSSWSHGATIKMEFPKKLYDDELRDIECDVTNDEIKSVVWDCGTDKAPGPDGFTFGFFRRFWDLIQEDVYVAVRYFFVYSDIPKGCNLAFISLIPKIQNANLVNNFRPISLIGSLYQIIAKILANRLVGMLSGIVNEVQSAFVVDRQILDGPFILNEVIQCCKSKKKQALIFKVDFEKAYDSVRWDFLDDVLRKFGFGDKWHKWIRCCLRSSRGSILVNGSPTEEFQFGKGLKQGDPLSPFLFILIMESLYISFQRIMDVGLFKGIKIGGGLVNLSYLFYADDAVFVGQWCDSNITTLVHVLKCFHKAFGFRINMCKSKIMGVNVEGDMVNRAARKLGCLVLKTPFSYLGSMVGGNMSRKAMWNDILKRVKKRLSKWKMQMLSIRGKLTLVNSVLV
nr:RNA-directed DNA polymerase, eukaryota [Tanacetum cinerariifolium]